MICLDKRQFRDSQLGDDFHFGCCHQHIGKMLGRGQVWLSQTWAVGLGGDRSLFKVLRMIAVIIMLLCELVSGTERSKGIGAQSQSMELGYKESEL